MSFRYFINWAIKIEGYMSWNKIYLLWLSQLVKSP